VNRFVTFFAKSVLGGPRNKDFLGYIGLNGVLLRRSNNGGLGFCHNGRGVEGS